MISTSPSRRPFVTSLIVAVSLMVTVVGISAAPDHGWPGFRGPGAEGHSPETAVFAELEQFRLQPAWKANLGSGYSGVSVVGDHVVTMFAAGDNDVLADFDAKTGVERWRYTIEPTYKGHDGSHDGPLSSPLIDDGRVFGLSAMGKLFALGLADGKPQWAVNLVEKYEARKPHYGFATSPIMQDGVLVVEIGAADGTIAGFDPKTGELKWKAGTDGVNYQSPIAFELDGKQHVLATGNTQLVGIDPKTGNVLWEHPHGGTGARGMMSLVPVPAGEGRLFLANKDDSSQMLQLAMADGKVTGSQLWEGRSIRNSYNVPIYYDGHVYGFSNRFLTCVDAQTGEAKWRSRRPGDGFLILVDRHLLILTKQGSVHVAKASSDEYQEVASTTVFDDLAWAGPSFADGHIYARSLGQIARVDVREGLSLAERETPDPLVAGSEFQKWVATVAAASDKNAKIDAFMEKVEQFPVLEGEELVHFVYRGEGGDLAVAGDMIGARQERPMEQIPGTDFFYYSMRLEPDTRSNYLFIRDYEEQLDALNPRKTTTTLIGKDMEMSFTGAEMEMSWFAMPDWQAPAFLEEPAADHRGRIETIEIDSAALEGKHSVDLYLPAGYDKGNARHPVVIVHGGPAAQNRGQWPTALDNLIGDTVQPILVAFVAPAPRGKDAEYAKMIGEELVPYLDENYRTVASPESRANVGQGFSAFTALFCTVMNPGVIGKLATQSIFLFDSMWAGVQPMVKSADEVPLEIYLDWGKYDLRNPHEAWNLADSSKQLEAYFKDKGYQPVGIEAHDGTGWSSWSNRTDDLLETLFPAEGSAGTH